VFYGRSGEAGMRRGKLLVEVVKFESLVARKRRSMWQGGRSEGKEGRKVAGVE